MKEELDSSSSKCVQLLCSDDLLNQILSEVRDIKTCMSSRLTSLELKISVLVQTCEKISSRLDTLEKSGSKNIRDKLVINDVESNDNVNLSDVQELKRSTNDSGKLKIVPLSSESDYPNGSWLGDPKSPTNRVRCNISPQNLFHINATCFTPEKMALCLIDHLFTREELAVSNISGRSRWGKKQLNPFLIYGIKTHLKYKFFITEKDWQKICQNIDAKCRFAWKRNQKLTNQSKNKLKNSSPQNSGRSKNNSESISNNEEINFDFEHLQNSNLDFNSCVKVITQAPCELRILNATPAQIAHLQDSQEIILAEEMLPDENEGKPLMINGNSEVSMNNVVMDGIVDGLGSDLTIEQDSNHSEDDNKDDEPTRSNRERLSIHDAPLEEELKLEVELHHETAVDDNVVT